MLTNRAVLIGFFLAVFINSFSQNNISKDKLHSIEKGKYTISGFIEDKITGEKLPGTLIKEEYSHSGLVSNNYGFYSFTV